VPNIPTFSELGVKDTNVTLWFGMFAPAGTPETVLRQLNDQLNAVQMSSELVVHIAGLGFEASGSTRAEVAATVQREQPAFAAIIKLAGIKSD
jgi:tripartite-type tricarboxylate transporter receptor subunit TctC